MKKFNVIIIIGFLFFLENANAQLCSNCYFAGFDAGNNTATGVGNTGVGAFSLNAVSSGGYNTGIGNSTLESLTTGTINCAMGDGALTSLTTGSNNTMLGQASGSTMTTGNYNTGIGTYAMEYSGNVSYCTAVGVWSLLYNTSNYSTAFGYSALYNNTTGINDACGANALYTNTTGTYNVGMGQSSLQSNSTGSYNTAVGNQSAYSNTTGNANSAFGDSALYGNTTGFGNVGVGKFALKGNQTGNYNTAIGEGAGDLRTTYTNCTFLGAAADANSTWSNSTSLGVNAYVTGSNTIQLGNSSISAIVCAVQTISSSDKRFKKDIQENVPGLAFIKELRPVTYHFDMHKMDDFIYGDESAQYEKNMADAVEAKGKILYTGFLAQDVEASAEKIGYNFSGVHIPQSDKDMYGLAYSEFVVPLVKGMQEQQTMIEDQADTIKTLEQTVVQQQEVLNNVLTKIEIMASQLSDIKECCSNSAANSTGINGSSPSATPQLFNAVPNPASSTTTIYYFVPSTFISADLQISDVNGQVIQTVAITTAGNSSSQIHLGDLANSTYFYSLIVDGKLIASKTLSVILK